VGMLIVDGIGRRIEYRYECRRGEFVEFLHYTCFGAYGDTVGFRAFGFYQVCRFLVFIVQHCFVY
jgi:hypothetical protein